MALATKESFEAYKEAYVRRFPQVLEMATDDTKLRSRLIAKSWASLEDTVRFSVLFNDVTLVGLDTSGNMMMRRIQAHEHLQPLS